MENKVIEDAAMLYYKENVEGEPLTYTTPRECFIAGAEFMIQSKKNRNNRSVPENNVNPKVKNMTLIKKDDPHEGMIKVSGFYITAAGDSSVGINSATWEIKNEFYFNDVKDLVNFRKELVELFAFYSGETPEVVTFEEHQIMLETELRNEYKAHPVRYLVKSSDYSGSYMRPAPLTGMYSSDIAECIHFELEDWIRDSRGSDEIIDSTSDEYWQIIKKALHDAQRSLDVNGQHYRSAENSVQLLLKELHYGK